MSHPDPEAGAARPPVPEPLPAVGHRLELIAEDGERLVAVRRKDGALELHGRDITVLDAVSARALGALAAGHLVVAPELLDRADSVLGGLELDWVRVPPGAAAVGRSIEDLAVRRRTGVTIVAILRGSVPIVDPDPNQRLEAGDELVVAGRAQARAELERFLVEGG